MLSLLEGAEQDAAQPGGSKCPQSKGAPRPLFEAGAAKYRRNAALSWEANREDFFLLSLLLCIFQQVKLDLVVEDCKQ